jgi:hypothetical protein
MGPEQNMKSHSSKGTESRTTLEELRESVALVLALSEALSKVSGDLNTFMLRVDTYVNDEDFSPSIDVDVFIATQSPIYNGLLVAIEEAADALGTDD